MILNTNLKWAGFLLIFLSTNLHHANAQSTSLEQEIRNTIEKGIAYFHSLNINGGYVHYYSLDLQEKWGEDKSGNATIEVQPPGTPSVGQVFLRAYRVTRNAEHLEAAQEAAQALIQGQNKLGGWDHEIHFDGELSTLVSFDDDQTQSALRFLMALDLEINDVMLTEAIEKGLQVMLDAQWENGAWPHIYPRQGNYHDLATYNDGGINDCIRVMIQADSQYSKPVYRESLRKAADFVVLSQLPPPQPGWAQQYNEYLQPAWARTFEPPAICPLVTILNIHTLIDLYLYTGRKTYLEAIPDALRWLNESQLPNGKWGRFLELYTNKPLYYDRGRKRVSSTEELSIERREGYRYELDLVEDLREAFTRFRKVSTSSYPVFPAQEKISPTSSLARLESRCIEIIKNQNAEGRWVTHNDRFKKRERGERWQGEYRIADRISTAQFIDHISTLCRYLESARL